MKNKNIFAVVMAIVMCLAMSACGNKAPNFPCYDNTGLAKLENRVTFVDGDEEMEEWAEYYGGDLVSYEDNFYSFEVETIEVPNGAIYEYNLVLLDGSMPNYDPVGFTQNISDYDYEYREKVDETIAWGKTLPEYIGEDPTTYSVMEYADKDGNVMLEKQSFSTNSYHYTISVRYAE